MELPQLKPLSQAQYKYSEKKRQRTEIRFDIKEINKVLSSNDDVQMKGIHMLIDSKYSAYVPNWGHSMYGYIDKYGFNYEYLDKESLLHNLTLMKYSLEGFAMGIEKSTQKSYDTNSNINVNVNNSNDINFSVSISFEKAREQVENMASLTNEQSREIIDKITEIENVINGRGTKKSKWEIIKPILVWLADKSFDVGMTMLPLLLKLQE